MAGVTFIIYVLSMLDCLLISSQGSITCVDEVFNLVFRDKAATDYVVRNKTVPSRAECSVLCHQEEWCVSVAYSGSGECVLYSQLPQALTVVSTPDSDIYYRQGAVPISTSTLITSSSTSMTPMPVPSNVTSMTTPQGSTTPASLTSTSPTAVTSAPNAPPPTTMVTAATVTAMTTPATSTYTSTSAESMTTGTTSAPTSSSTTTTTVAAAAAATTTATTTTTTTTTTTAPTTSPTTTSTVAAATTTTATTTAATTTTTTITTTTTTTITTTTTTTPTTTTTTEATSQEVELWVAEVVSYSDQVSSDANAAKQVIGEPDVYPVYGHNDKAWGQSSIHGSQYVELKYAVKLFMSEVHVYETYRAGAVVSVQIQKPNGIFAEVYSERRIHLLASSRITKLVMINLLSYTIDVIRLWVAPDQAGGSVEIDAVKLVGMTDP